MKVDKGLADFKVDIDPRAPLFVIGVASDMVGVPIWTLRKLDEMGVVCPERVGVRTRCYSQVQIRRLTYVRYLMEERRVNISGVKVILEMEVRRG
ncbi:MAG: MerR family transcriptional regulator [Candidatus Omnitrophica bacterium]|nr:MerR family transcriptional regulator [Candidatus Omnitrophota bacterium]